ncbi:MAG: hypothetical protein CMG87_01585 [Marinobacter sp.]|nr:hypothetical protein [Marinobacter sp.]
MSVFDINFESRPEVVWLGNREVPLLVIDDVFKDPDAVRDYAFQRNFPESQAYYPGRHQPLSPSEPGIANFCLFMSRVLSKGTGRSISADAISTDFSIITTAENSLLENQGQPHIDSTPMLGVIYLNQLDFGGTVFFRNRDTGSMVVRTPTEREHYSKVTSARKNKHAEGYVIDSSGPWEKVISLEGRYNRLVIWPGNVWHSVEVKVPPEQGGLHEKRLTQRVIVEVV